ncbi:YheC/YheD family endospore coat-associated protein [Neobacillus kokaensis]|uniref:ATP-grasp domain-containing protein n=1 Tax=Neobacillus kokaensis TaxID=2759023 RepID=A0ABQ3N7J4_9BACI|nr:YheC/YheD family protein [Neobacillus kokaensis]GHH99562.1 hypothetical protein AM1BK_31050 [Neobacillus kokaensis]
MSVPYIGILVDGLIYSGIKHGVPYFERIHFYEAACKKHHLIPCYFRLKDLNIETGQVNGLVKGNNGKYELKDLQIPAVIHNRGLFFNNSSKEKLKRLQRSGVMIFNDWNRYGKLMVHQILNRDEDLSRHLPETRKASLENLKEMMEKHNELIIKPNSGSLGGGVILIKRIDNEQWTVTSHQQRWPFTDKLPDILQKKASSKYYIIQQRIPLAKSEGSPFDLRVSVQKNGTGEWQVTGIVGKVAKKGSYVTNVAQGGTCRPLWEIVGGIPELDYDMIYKQIEEFSLQAVKELESHFPSLADVGLDIGLTEDGFPMFIECNGRDLRITFGKAKMMDVWKATYTTPISYARYLLDSKGKGE